MFVEVFSNNGNKYLRLVEGYYTKDKNGNPTCRKKVIKSIQHSNNIKLTDYPKTIVDNF